MDKDALIQKYFQKLSTLHTNDENYQQNIKVFFQWLLENDEVKKDITTNLLVPSQVEVSARIISKKSYVIAGLEEVLYLLKNFTDLEVKSVVNDGQFVESGDVILTMNGGATQILAYERTVLNILQRMSGIATETQKYVQKVENSPVKIAATRKTPWTVLDKKAVALGGGMTHRLTLEDGILVKDNHLLLAQKENGLTEEKEMVIAVLKKLLDSVDNTFIEIEVEQEESLLALVDIFSNEKTTNTLGILLDNFTPERAQSVLKKVKNEQVIFEGSGGITYANIEEWMNTGVDVISIGALTHSPQAADLSLEIL